MKPQRCLGEKFSQFSNFHLVQLIESKQQNYHKMLPIVSSQCPTDGNGSVIYHATRWSVTGEDWITPARFYPRLKIYFQDSFFLRWERTPRKIYTYLINRKKNVWWCNFMNNDRPFWSFPNIWDLLVGSPAVLNSDYSDYPANDLSSVELRLVRAELYGVLLE